jgi:hypothetical protein
MAGVNTEGITMDVVSQTDKRPQVLIGNLETQIL